MARDRAGSVRRRHSTRCPRREGERCSCSAGWQIRYRLPDGRRKEEGGFGTREVANARLDAVLGRVRRGEFRELQPITLRKLAERWLEIYAEPNVKPATLAGYRSMIEAHLVPYFGDQLLTTITREHIEGYLAEKVAARNGSGERVWSPKTIHNTYTVLRRMLESAVEWDYLAVNPAARVRPVRREQPEREALEVEEIAAVLDAAEGIWQLIFRTAILSGLRRGELLGLRWDDLELERQRLHVRQTYGRYGFASPKSKAGRRVVPLTEGLVHELRRHKLASVPNDHDLVFASEVGTPLDPDNLKRAWARTLRKAKLRHVPFHSTRHTAVSLMIAQENLNPKQLQAVVGHASIQLTYDTYGHLMPDAFEGFGAGLDEALRTPSTAARAAETI